MANAIPIELLLQNFGSHRNTIIPLCEKSDPNERVFITGSSGKGKSHILEAMQYVLGKKIMSEKEFFHYEEHIIDGKKQKVYQDHVKIEMKILNYGPEYLAKYPKNEVLTIGLEAFKGNIRKNRHYIRLRDGFDRSITLEELRQFGVFDDPLMFIDDQQTDYWIRTSPRDRYEKIAKFMGISTFREDVKHTYNEFNEAEKRLKDEDTELNKAKGELELITEKYDRFKRKEKILDQIGTLERDLVHAKAFESYYAYMENERLFYEQFQQKQNLIAERESLGHTITSKQSRVENLMTQIASLTTERESSQSARDELLTDIRSYQRILNEKLSFIKGEHLEIPLLVDWNLLSDQCQRLDKEIKVLEADILSLSKEYHDKKELLELRKKDQIRVGTETMRLVNELRKSGITCELLYEALEFREDKGEWIDYLETLLSLNKYGIIVNEENREQAESINRKLQLDAVLLYPRKEFVKMPHPGLRNWTHILKVNSQQVREDTVMNLLHLMLGSTYFAADSDEKEIFLRQQPRSQIICLDGYHYNVYSQRKFLREKPTYVIGKGAKEKEIKRIEKELDILDQQNVDLRRNLILKQSDEKSTKIKLEYLELLKKSEEILEKQMQFDELNKKLRNLDLELSNPEAQIKQLQESIDSDKDKKVQLTKEIEECHKSLETFQVKLSDFAYSFYKNLNGWNELIKYNNTDDGNKSFLIPSEKDLIGDYLEADNLGIEYKFVGIHEDAKNTLDTLNQPKDTANNLERGLVEKRASLVGYEDVDQSIIRRYEEVSKAVEKFELHLETYRKDIQLYREKFETAMHNLENELMKWQDSVNKEFKEILQGLELDGKMEFNPSHETEGNYELNLLVANTVGGSTDPIEDMRFSKGERLRVSIAFEMAILTQSKSPYFVWDEFDQNIGDDHRELLANMIAKHLPDRKLIGISPRQLIKGYMRIFPQIIMVWKNDNQRSMISISRFTEDIKGQGDLFEAIQENKDRK